MTHITLTPPEAHAACLTGISRNLACLFRGQQTAPGTPSFEIHCEGALGEMAAAKAIRCYNPLTVDTFKEGSDIGARIQVRTRSRHNYDLLVRDNDQDDHAFVLVTGGCPDYLVHGWMWGGEAKQEKWRASYGGHGPAYFVPQAELMALDELPGEVK